MCLYLLSVFVGSVSFNFETAGFFDNEPAVLPSSDNCNFPSFDIAYNSEQPYLSTECRCLGHRNFSILAKFRMGDSGGSVSLLSLGNRNEPSQLELIYDGCRQELVLQFDEECGAAAKHTSTYEFDISFVDPSDWIRYALEITEHSISLFVNCEKVIEVPTLRQGCSIRCSENGLNHILQEIDGSPCGDGSTKVQYTSMCLYVYSVLACVYMCTVYYSMCTVY